MDEKVVISENMRVADARANITELISRVRLLRWTVFLSNRRTPMAALVPIELGQLIRRAGGADAAAAILEQHLGPQVANEED
jgi:antitoxin (DNA-binding transcriptional repressor) of toxin-antitoxin stability system